MDIFFVLTAALGIAAYANRDNKDWLTAESCLWIALAVVLTLAILNFARVVIG